MIDLFALIAWMFIEAIAWFIGYIFLAIFGIEPKPRELPYDRCLECDYNLTGTLKAKRDTCPECGKKIANWQRFKWKARTRRDALRGEKKSDDKQADRTAE